MFRKYFSKHLSGNIKVESDNKESLVPKHDSTAVPDDCQQTDLNTCQYHQYLPFPLQRNVNNVDTISNTSNATIEGQNAYISTNYCSVEPVVGTFSQYPSQPQQWSVSSNSQPVSNYQTTRQMLRTQGYQRKRSLLPYTSSGRIVLSDSVTKDIV